MYARELERSRRRDGGPTVVTCMCVCFLLRGGSSSSCVCVFERGRLVNFIDERLSSQATLDCVQYHSTR